MFVIERAPVVVYHLYQLSFAIMAALITIILFPRPTVAYMLVGLVVWDVFSVLSPCGPLKLISKRWERMVHKQQDDNVNDNDDDDHNSQNLEGRSPKTIETQSITTTVFNVCLYSSEGTNLGLGDFVYFSVLVAECGLAFTPLVAITSGLCLVVGLMVTLCLVAVHQRSMPALPISLVLAFGNIVAMNYAVGPWHRRLAANMIHI